MYDVIIVGAGPAGIGCCLALRRAGVENVVILDATQLGSSFRRWPKQMRLITPSFHSNPFFQTDLNGLTPDTSPADFFQKEHLSGNDYAVYLQTLVRHFNLNVQEQEKVLELIPEQEGYSVRTGKETYRTNAVIWATGEFSHPKSAAFPGSEYCVHSSTFRDWEDYHCLLYTSDAADE